MAKQSLRVSSILTTVLWLTIGVFATSNSAGQQGTPLTRSQIESLIDLRGMPDTALAGEVRDRGLAFTLTPEILDSLKTRGAGPLTLAALEIRLVRAPTITEFKADSDSVHTGDSVTLQWSVNNADHIELRPLGQAVPLNSHQRVALRETTTFTLFAERAGLSASRALTVVVMPSAGELYAEGKQLFDGKKYSEAAALLRDAAQAGSADAAGLLGTMLFDHIGIPQDYTEALKWYRIAANAGNGTAMANIGSMYYIGAGVPKDYHESLQWFTKAAEAGNTNGMWLVGVQYKLGQGVFQNYTEAFSWFRRSADAGNPIGATQVGTLYYDIYDNYRDAFDWYVKAANAGEPTAMNNLGKMYEVGSGVTSNINAAIDWYRKAAAAGSPMAADSLHRLNADHVNTEVRQPVPQLPEPPVLGTPGSLPRPVQQSIRTYDAFHQHTPGHFCRGKLELTENRITFTSGVHTLQFQRGAVAVAKDTVGTLARQKMRAPPRGGWIALVDSYGNRSIFNIVGVTQDEVESEFRTWLSGGQRFQ